MISREEVLNLSALARLTLADEEVSALQKDMSSILDYIGQLATADISSAEAPEGLRNAMRQDDVRPEEDPLAGKEETLRAAFPAREGGFNSVRKIIEKDA